MLVYMNKYDTSLKAVHTAAILGNIAQLHTQTNEKNFKQVLQPFCKHQNVVTSNLTSVICKCISKICCLTQFPNAFFE